MTWKSFLGTWVFPTVLTLAAFLYAYAIDRADGGTAWIRLATGTLIAAAGFFGGAWLIARTAKRLRSTAHLNRQ